MYMKWIYLLSYIALFDVTITLKLQHIFIFLSRVILYWYCFFSVCVHIPLILRNYNFDVIFLLFLLNGNILNHYFNPLKCSVYLMLQSLQFLLNWVDCIAAATCYLSLSKHLYHSLRLILITTGTVCTGCLFTYMQVFLKTVDINNKKTSYNFIVILFSTTLILHFKLRYYIYWLRCYY